MATETKTFYPGAYDSSSSVTITNASNSVGKGSNNASYATIKPTRLGTSGNVYWPFDTSAIPDDAEIVSVSCKAKANVSSISAITTATLQLYSGNTAKGSAVSFKDSSASAKVITAGTWTKSELASARLRLVLMGSTSASFFFYGADLTVTYTVNNEKFMLKLGGAWHDVARVFKKVNGIWVEQTDLANVIEDGVRYKNGGEYVAPVQKPTVTITGTGAVTGDHVTGGQNAECYVEIDGVKYSSPNIIAVDRGSVMACLVYALSVDITLNGNSVGTLSGFGQIKQFAYTITESCNVNLFLDNSSSPSARISITTS